MERKSYAKYVGNRRDAVSRDSTRVREYRFFSRVLFRLSRVEKQIIVGAPKIFIRSRRMRHRSFGKHLNRPNKRQRKRNTQYSACYRRIVFSGYFLDIAFIWIFSCRFDLVYGIIPRSRFRLSFFW